MRAAWLANGPDAREAVERSRDAGALSKTSYNDKALATLWPAMQDWSRGEAWRWTRGNLELLTSRKLVAATNKGKDALRPQSPLFDAAQAYVDAQALLAEWLEHRKLVLVHRVRDEATHRLARLKRQRRVRSFDDLIGGVARALEGEHARALIGQLRRQYPAALVDEFQDTDARQWSIFQRVFGDDPDDALPALDDDLRPARFLALIGDPKQAIYGFRGGDVHTYLRARENAQAAPPLARNFRSRPCLLRAVDTLYAAAGDDAFGATGIAFHPVQPGGRRSDTACLLDGLPAPALTLRRLPSRVADEKCSAEESRDRAARACTQAIHETLALAASG
ncbi:UvrD-helicase domain-containing protein, partial [Cognatilysobacter lacus]